MSRHKAIREYGNIDLRKKMAEEGVVVQAMQPRVLAEEAGGAYKNVDEVVQSVERAGLCKIVARLVPVGVIKG